MAVIKTHDRCFTEPLSCSGSVVDPNMFATFMPGYPITIANMGEYDNCKNCGAPRDKLRCDYCMDPEVR